MRCLAASRGAAEVRSGVAVAKVRAALPRLAGEVIQIAGAGRVRSSGSASCRARIMKCPRRASIIGPRAAESAVAPRRKARIIEPGCDRPIAVSHAPAMKRIVLPSLAPSAEASIAEASIAEVFAESTMEPEVIEEEAIHEESAAEPSAAPAPPEAPSGPSNAPSGEEPAEENSMAEPESEPDAWVQQRRVVTPNRRSPNVRGIINRDVDHLRIRRLYDDRALPVLRLGGHCLLRGRCELAVLLSAGAHPLHRRHNVALLGEIGVSKIRGPAHVASHQ